MNLPKRTGSSTGYLYGFLCAFFSAVMIVLIKRVQESLPTLSILVIVLAVAALVLSGVMFTGGRHRLLLRVSAHGWFWVGGIAVLTFFCYWTLFAAIDLLDPTVASFLGRAETLVTIAFGVVFLGERFRRIEIAGAVLVLSGVGLIRYTGGVEISRGSSSRGRPAPTASCWRPTGPRSRRRSGSSPSSATMSASSRPTGRT